MYDNFMNQVKKLDVIIYARLSKEEEGKTEKEQSQSIQNQIEICREFIEEERQEYSDIEYRILDSLYDDGISGTTFNRNSFNKVIKILEAKKANMLITKDLSRLGREHINADNYIEKWFPERNIRYVAILDGVDTYMQDNVNNDITPIKNWMNEMYAKNTSKAIKRTFKTKRNKGLWTGGEPPLGYIVDPQQKGKIIIDTNTAEIVKKIFYLAKEGKKEKEIATILMTERIPIPTILKGNKRHLNQKLMNIWSRRTIRTILQNEMYLGHMVQGKTIKLNFKSNKKIYLPPKDWIKIKYTHEPIIDQQTFDIVQSLIKSNKNITQNSYPFLLKGMIKCAECNHTIGIQHYKNRNINYTICNYYRKYGKKQNLCTAHRQNYNELEKLVLKNIQNECLKYIDQTNFIDLLKHAHQEKYQYSEIKLKIEKCYHNMHVYTNQMDLIYEDKIKEIISEEQYLRFIQKKQECLEIEKYKLEQYQKELETIEQNIQIEPDYTKIINEFLSLKNPSKLLITELIDSIYLQEDGTIHIYYKIKNPLQD